MNYFPSKEPSYDIEPWLEQPSNIPIKFMTSTNFAKSSKSTKNVVGKQSNLQIGTDSIYFIKNNQEEKVGEAFEHKRYPRTTESSPKMKAVIAQNNENNTKMHKNLSTHSHFARNNKQKLPINPEGMALTHSTKNLVFEFKRIKKLDKETLYRSKSKQMRKSKEGFKSNLMEMYKRSTTLNHQKDSKNQEETKKDQNVKTILTLSNQNHEQTKMASQKNVLKSQLSLALNRSGYQKRQFYLMVERKLFLLKSNFIMGQSHSKLRINSSKNIQK